MSPLRGCALVGDSTQALTDLATRRRPSGAGYRQLNSLHAISCIILAKGREPDELGEISARKG
jgi:hypothetical protein